MAGGDGEEGRMVASGFEEEALAANFPGTSATGTAGLSATPASGPRTGYDWRTAAREQAQNLIAPHFPVSVGGIIAELFRLPDAELLQALATPSHVLSFANDVMRPDAVIPDVGAGDTLSGEPCPSMEDPGASLSPHRSTHRGAPRCRRPFRRPTRLRRRLRPWPRIPRPRRTRP